jgi:hypothetical protein
LEQGLNFTLKRFYKSEKKKMVFILKQDWNNNCYETYEEDFEQISVLYGEQSS